MSLLLYSEHTRSVAAKIVDKIELSRVSSHSILRHHSGLIPVTSTRSATISHSHHHTYTNLFSHNS